MSDEPNASEPRLQRAALLLLIVGALLRLPGMFADFWFDEIWSLSYANAMESWLDVFSIHHDNNHYLNTLALYVLGDQGLWMIYRLPAMLMGIATLLLAFAALRRAATPANLCYLALLSFATPLVIFASEARGYAGACLAAVAALLLFRDRPGNRALASYSVIAIFGLLSHLTFVFCLAGIGLMLLVRMGRERSRLIALVIAHLPIALAAAALYWVDIRHVHQGGGAPSAVRDALIEGLAGMMGLATTGAVGIAAACFVVAVTVAQLWREARQGERSLVALIGGAVATAGIILLLPKSEWIAARYFVVLYPLVYFVWARGLVACPKPVAFGLFAIFLLLHGLQIRRFMAEGRGDPFATVRYLAENSTEPIITVGGDHDLRTPMVLRFYARYFPDRQFRYVTMESVAEAKPEWIIWTHNSQGQVVLTLADGQSNYALVKEFKLSGSYLESHIFQRSGLSP